MSFGHPWMLLGALAALIPLLVHLFDRRRPRPHAFAALAFVLRSQRRTASRLKLKRLLLYALRTLVLLAIPVALALPQWRRSAAAAAVVQGPAATAIVLDASMGMRFKDGKSLFEKAQASAREAVRGLAPEEPATVLVCAPGVGAPAAPGFERTKLLDMLQEAKPSYEVADLSRCIELATHALEPSPLAAKRVVVVSAFFASSFHLEAPPPTFTGAEGKRFRPEVVLRDVAEGARGLPNHALVDVKGEPAPQVGPHAFQFTFTARNFSDAPAHDVTASLEVEGKVVAKTFLEVPAQGTLQKALTYRFDQGGTVAAAIVLTSDALGVDDRRDLVVQVPRELRALVLNGKPSSVKYRDEAFFVDAAFSAPGSPVRETLRDVDTGMRENFQDYDLIALLNVPAPTDEDVKRLRAFVEQGGGLLISAGDHVDPDAYNARFGALLPRAIRLVKTAVQPADPDVERRAARLKDLAQDHPLFAPFTGKAREGLLSARFFRYLLLESSGGGQDPNANVLATFEDGAPAVAVKRVGKGRVLLFTSTLEREWTDFPIRTSFLPLVQRFASYLAGALEEHEAQRVRVGQTLTLTPEPGAAPSTVKGPSLQLPVRTQADGAWLVGPLTEPGAFRVLDAAGRALPSLDFAVGLDPLASDLTRLKPDELAGYFGEETVKSASRAEAPAVPLWTWLLVAAAVAFFLEGTLLRK